MFTNVPRATLVLNPALDVHIIVVIFENHVTFATFVGSISDNSLLASNNRFS